MRITDQTAHGGVVVMGYPTVVVGHMPASRIGDMHTCPMFTGLVPHVGGPFILGSFTVIVGGMPQSRVGDMLICVGPPDTAIKGEPTVLVGVAGSKGFLGMLTGLAMAALSVAQQIFGGGFPRAELQSDGTVQTHYSSAVWLAGTFQQQAHNIHELNAVKEGPGGADFINGLDNAGPAVRLNVVGDPVRGHDLHPGQQSYENCAVQSAQQIIHQTTGSNYTEAQMEQVAVSPKNSGYTRDGGTPADGEALILDNGGVPAHMEPQTSSNLNQALANGQGVITNHDAGKLWNDPRYLGRGHAVNTTGAIQDSNGNTLAYVINDTGNNQNTRTVPAADFNNSLGSWDMAVTNNPIY